jgi:hypothetical protein
MVIMNEELKKIVDEMVQAQKLERKPVLRGYGRSVRIVLEWFIKRCIPPRDVMGVKQYLTTGEWTYPTLLRRVRGPRRGTYLLGLELFFLAQTVRHKMFYEGTVRALREAGAYLTTVY